LLVSHINSETHRNHAEAADLDDVIEFILINTWSYSGNMESSFGSGKNDTYGIGTYDTGIRCLYRTG